MFLQENSQAAPVGDITLNLDESVDLNSFTESMAQADAAWFAITETAMMEQHNSIVNEAGKGIMDTLKKWFKAVKDWIKKTWNKFVGWLKAMGTKISNLFKSDKKWLKENKEALEKFNGKFSVEGIYKNVLEGKLTDGRGVAVALLKRFGESLESKGVESTAKGTEMVVYKEKSALEKAIDALYAKAGSKRSDDESVAKAASKVVLGTKLKKSNVDAGVVGKVLADITKLIADEKSVEASLKNATELAKAITKTLEDAEKTAADDAEKELASAAKKLIESRRSTLNKVMSMTGSITSAVSTGRGQGMAILREAVTTPAKESSDDMDDSFEEAANLFG